MVRISIDDSVAETSGLESAERVEDIVRAVATSLPPNRIVTSIAVDGQMVPRQQSSQALSGRLEAIRDLQIRTADAQVWARNGLDRAITDIDRLQKSLLMTAELFRDSRQAEGNRIFVRCIEGLEQFLDTIVLTRLAMKLDFQRLSVDGITLARLENDFSCILKAILECQEQANFEGVAEKIEYELLPCFHSWGRALNSLQLSMHSNA